MHSFLDHYAVNVAFHILYIDGNTHSTRSTDFISHHVCNDQQLELVA